MGIGIVLIDVPNNVYISRPIQYSIKTNNVAELTAIKVAIETLYEMGLTNQQIRINTYIQ